MAEDDKTVKITGEVVIDQSSAQGALVAMVAELKAMRAGWEASAKSITAVEKDIKGVKDQTEKAGAAANIFKGVWQGVGQAISLTSILGVIKGISSSIGEAMGEAQSFKEMLAQMKAKGVEDVSALEVGIARLANEMRVSMSDAGKAFKSAFSVSNDQTVAMETARTALINYRLAGADASKTIQASEQIIKSFNLEANEQSLVIMKVADAAKAADISQDAMYDSIAKLAPIANKLGTNLDQLLNVTVAGVKNGLQPTAKGIAGLGEIMEQLADPSDELRQAMIDNHLVLLQSQPAWEAQSKVLAGMKAEYERLNAEIKEFQRTSSEIGMINAEAQRRVEVYEQLAQKQQSGERLSREEKRAMKELGEQLRDYNRELAKFDELTGTITNSSSRKMSVVLDQLKTRMAGGAEAQKDLSEQSARAQFAMGDLETTMQGAQSELDRLAQKLQTELPAAISAAISGSGFGPFLARIAECDQAMTNFSTQAQIVMSSVAGNTDVASTSTKSLSEWLTEAGLKLVTLFRDGLSQVEQFKIHWDNLKMILAKPFNEAVQIIIGGFNYLFSPDRMATIQTWMTAVAGMFQTFATDIASRITSDIEAGLNGGKGWGEILLGWLSATWNMAVEGIRTLIQPLMDAVYDGLYENEGKLSDVLSSVFGSATEKALSRMGQKIQGFFAKLDFLDNALPHNTFYDREEIYGSRNTEAAQRGTTTNNSMTMQPTFNNTGADPEQITQKVMREIHQMERLGFTGGRIG